jgi:hypothetical protein
VLAAFARAVGAGEDKLIVLVLDNAGWHGACQEFCVWTGG